ncbi:DUF6088 family protein [Microbulbifer sp. VAAC004]|uniref:DUF6088 family protein n=1 Tax=unclassified Microbulbifer TaxID=2619833 RepID=UPI0040393DFC
MSVSKSVHQRIKRFQRGEPFPVNRLYTLGSETAVQKALSRLVKAGELVRVSKGLYARPKTISSIPGLKVQPSATKVAIVWARQYKHKLVPQGQEEAYRLGLQTQAPMKTIFWTSGPSKEFRVGNEVVVAKHTSASKLKWGQKPEGALLRGLSTIPSKSASPRIVKLAIARLRLGKTEARETLKKLEHSNLPERWIVSIRETRKTIK